LEAHLWRIVLFDIYHYHSYHATIIIQRHIIKAVTNHEWIRKVHVQVMVWQEYVAKQESH
jgi:hypothetical protein